MSDADLPADGDRAEPLRAARHLADDSVRELLATATGAAGGVLERADRRSVHTRTGRSVSHVFDATIRVGDQRRDVLLVAHADARPLPEGAFELVSEGDRVAVWRFPFDPFLPGLPSAIDRRRVRELLDQLGAAPGTVTLRTRAYRPSRRAVIEVMIDGERDRGRILYLKVLAGRRADELAGMHRQLQGTLPVPRVIGVSSRQGILALEALEGITLRAALVEGAAVPDPAELTELSARFSRSGLVSRRDPQAFADPRRHVAPLSALVPDRHRQLLRLAEAAAAIDATRLPVHGDLHDGQLLLTDGAVTGLLDIDGSGNGLLAQDAGNLVAHIQVIGEVWPQVRDRVERYATEVAAAYRPQVGADDLARATAGAWLGLATGPHRAQDANWPEATRARIDRAEFELGVTR